MSIQKHSDQHEAATSFARLVSVVQRLRAPDGCPWDREQSPMSLRSDLLEESYECVQAISEGDAAHIEEELGDVFLLATMISYQHEEQHLFSISSVLEGICEKLIRRHPHVFGDTQVHSVGEVLENWQKIKEEKEGRPKANSILDEVSKVLPPLERAYKMQKKAAKKNFDWPRVEAVVEKVQEELGEVLAAANQQEREQELGDLLFAVINLCRHYKVDPAVALQGTNERFAQRFAYVEKKMAEKGLPMEASKIDIMEAVWQEAKEQEAKRQ